MIDKIAMIDKIHNINLWFSDTIYQTIRQKAVGYGMKGASTLIFNIIEPILKTIAEGKTIINVKVTIGNSFSLDIIMQENNQHPSDGLNPEQEQKSIMDIKEYNVLVSEDDEAYMKKILEEK
jgi:hypothetical protein